MDSVPPLSDDVSMIADELRRGLGRILGEAFASLFLYGAVAFPRPDRWKIDFDYHVLVHRPLVDTEREDVSALYVELAGVSELGGDLDGYFVLLADAARPEPPPHQLDLGNRDDVWVLHRAHVHAGRFFLIEGLDPIDIVPEPAWSEIEAGLRAEMAFIVTHPDATAFGILNAARILYSFMTHDAVMSKYQAAEWALVTLPTEWHEAVRAAMRWYSQSARAGDAVLLERSRQPFVEFVARSLPPTPLKKLDEGIADELGAVACSGASGASRARAIGWVFVVAIAYHGVLAAIHAVEAATDGNWTYAVELGAIALVATAIVIGALASAARSKSRTC